MTAAKRLELSLEKKVSARLRDSPDFDVLRDVVENALAAEGLHGLVEVSLVVAGDATLRRLNKAFRGIDRTTDVLSFPLLDRDELDASRERFAAPRRDSLRSPPGEPMRLGDIVISMPRAKRQAVRFGHSESRELGYLAVHGVLHLLGYDHETETDRQVMREKEEAALRKVGLER